MAIANPQKDLMQNSPAMTPKAAPVTPYQRASDIWNDRQGRLIKSAANWRKAFFATLLFSGALTAGLVYESTRLSIQPYFVQVNDQTGQTHIVGEINRVHFTPNDAVVTYFLRQWVQWVRNVPLDPVVLKQNWNKAYALLTPNSNNELNSWARKNPYLSSVGQNTVSVQIVSAVPIAGSHSYQVRWHEIVRDNTGAIKDQYNMTGTFTVAIHQPKDDRTLAVNPAGIYITNFSWARDQ